MDRLTSAFQSAERSHLACTLALRASQARQLVQSPGGALAQAGTLTKAQEQYKHNVGWPYVAIRAVAQRVASQALCVGRGPGRRKATGDELVPLPAHPLLDLVDRPNSLMTRWALLNSTVASLELTGRGYWWLPTGDGAREIWPLPSHWVEPADAFRSSWKIRTRNGQTVNVPQEEICPFILPDPADPFAGKSPLQSQSMAVATDESIQGAQHSAFSNAGFPRHALRVGRLPGMVPGQAGERPVLTKAQRADLSASVLSLYRKTAQSGEPLVLDGLIEGIDTLSTTPSEMDFLQSGQQTKSRILQAYGVNPIVVGEVVGANRAQAAVAEQAFVSTCVNPLLEMLSQSITRWVCPLFGNGLTAWFSPAVANDAELQLRRWDTALKHGAATLNEFRRHVLNLGDMPGGNAPPTPPANRNGRLFPAQVTR